MGKGSTRRRGKGYGEGYDKIDWTADHQQDPKTFEYGPGVMAMVHNKPDGTMCQYLVAPHRMCRKCGTINFMDEAPGPVPPYASPDEQTCGAKTKGYVCNAAKGHDGHHAAYGGSLTVPVLAWR